MIFKNLKYIEKQRTSCLVRESFVLSSIAKGLARKPCEEQVKFLRNPLLVFLVCDVPERLVPEIFFVRHLSRLVPLAAKDALSTELLACKMEASNSSEQINKRKMGFHLFFGHVVTELLISM